MKKRARLTRRQDFQLLLAGKRIFAGRALVAFGISREDGRRRIGVAASRRLAGTVARNRARRRLREAARARLLAELGADGSPLPDAGIGYDVVLIAREGALTLPMAVLESEAQVVRRRLAAGSSSAPAVASP